MQAVGIPAGSAPEAQSPHDSLPLSAISLPAFSEPSQPSAKVSTKRSITRKASDIISARWRHPPDGCPEGPWVDLPAAIQKISQFTVDCTRGDGGFGIRKSSGLTLATTKQGRRQCLNCHKSHKQSIQRSERASTCIGTGCPFVLWLEESTEGWVIKDCNNQHNHELSQSVEESNISSSTRLIPEVLHTIAQAMQIAGNSAAVINNTLKANAVRMGLKCTWNYKDVYDTYTPSAHKSGADANGLLEWLIQRKIDHGFQYRVKSNEDDVMESVIFVLEDGQSLFERAQSDTCVAFDTTHGTNHLGVNLGLFVLVTPQGTTGIIAATLIVRQNAKTFEWVFTSFQECFDKASRLLFTDQDIAMAVALPEAWPSTIHLLCTFHISLNLNENVKRFFAFKEANKEWQRFSVIENDQESPQA